MELRLYEETARYQDSHWYLIGMREIVLELFGRENHPQPFRILDLGCGTGQYLPPLSHLGKVVGLDLSPAALSLCSREDGTGSSLVRADARKLPFPGRSFDLVWVSSILEHLADDLAGLREAVRILKPGGKIAISVPAHQLLWGHQDELAHHLRRYSRKELEDLCRACGLRATRITYYGATPLPPALLVRKAKNLLARFFPQAKEVSDFRLAAFPAFRRVFLAVLRLEKQGLRRFDLPFGMMLFVLAEKSSASPGS